MIVLDGAVQFCLSSFLFTLVGWLSAGMAWANRNLCPLCQVQLTLANRIQNRQGGTIFLPEFVFLESLSKTKEGKYLILMQRESTN